MWSEIGNIFCDFSTTTLQETKPNLEDCVDNRREEIRRSQRHRENRVVEGQQQRQQDGHPLLLDGPLVQVDEILHSRHEKQNADDGGGGDEEQPEPQLHPGEVGVVRDDGEDDVDDVEVPVDALEAGEGDVDEVSRVLEHAQVHHDERRARACVAIDRP